MDCTHCLRNGTTGKAAKTVYNGESLCEEHLKTVTDDRRDPFISTVSPELRAYIDNKDDDPYANHLKVLSNRAKAFLEDSRAILRGDDQGMTFPEDTATDKTETDDRLIGRMEERAAIVKWLRRQDNDINLKLAQWITEEAHLEGI